MRAIASVVLFAPLFALSSALPAQAGEEPGPRFKIDLPPVALTGVPFDLEISALDPDGNRDINFAGEVALIGVALERNGRLEAMTTVGPFKGGKLAVGNVVVAESGERSLLVQDRAFRVESQLRVIPGWLSLLPPLLAIILALAVRQVLLALFAGIWVGATLISGFNPFTGLLRALDSYLIKSFADPDHAAIVMFSLTLGGMVGVISRSGGTEGIVAALSRWAQKPRGGQVATWAMGVFIFFDDYANTLIVGNTMRPLTDKLKLSREKLSFIVDATAAPVVSIAFISSWVGFQVGLVDQAFKTMEVQRDAYLTFIASVPYASYSIFMMFFVLLVAVTMRDFSAMYRAEVRAATTGKVLRDGAKPLVDDKAIDLRADPGTPLRWYNAAIPIFTVIGVTMAGLYLDGWSSLGDKAGGARLGEIIGAANSFDVLMWASFIGAAVAIGLAVGQRIMNLGAALEAWLSGVKAMLIAMIILILAWAIGSVCADLNTAGFVVSATRGLVSPHLLPMLTFMVAAFIAFSTGTSWATMAILTPIVVPMAFGMTGGDASLDPGTSEAILLGTIGAVLSGSVFGDHCSPISDTTIMSSMTSAADHIDHVRTQLPYAVVVATIACVLGYLPAGYGWPMWICIPLGIGAMAAVLFIFGRKVAR